MNDSSTTTAVSRRVRKLRSERGWTQEQLAQMSQIAQPTISRIEKGKRTGNVATLMRIAKALECTVDDLLHRRPRDGRAA